MSRDNVASRITLGNFTVGRPLGRKSLILYTKVANDNTQFV